MYRPPKKIKKTFYHIDIQQMLCHIFISSGLTRFQTLKLNVKLKRKKTLHALFCYLIVNGRAAAQQNHLGTDESDEEVLMDGSPVRFRDAMTK